MIGDAEQYRELAARYREYGDIELQELAADAADLTETAQQALMAEMQSRKLSPKVKEAPKRERPALDGPDLPSLRDFAPLAPEECVWEFPHVEDAAAASRALGAEGIESVVIPAGDVVGDMRPPRLVVGPTDVEHADQILSRPIAAKFYDESADKDTYVEPVCPACLAPEPLLEAVEPANQWLCEACGHSWIDPLPEEA
jgi:hypothetical protein